MNGYKMIETDNMVEQFRFPKSKKKRIRKKWTKRGGITKQLRIQL